MVLILQVVVVGVVIEQVGLVDRVVQLLGDVDQLVQVFYNLIENVVKYGVGGGLVMIMLEWLDYELVMCGLVWVIVVVDKGEGIDFCYLLCLIECFYCVDMY